MNTTLNCLSWMQNQKDENPCAVAQGVGQLCNAEYTVSLIAFKEDAYVPNATSANNCTCSWSIYNLLSACAWCVGQQDEFTSWRTWTTNCAGHTSNSPLPSGLSFPQGIPYWATQNPFDWYNSIFNLTQASGAQGEDVTTDPLPTPTPTPARSASHVPVGAIVGGVIGAIAILIMVGFVIFCAVRRHRSTRVNVPSVNALQIATLPVTAFGNRTPGQAPGLGYTYVSPGPTSPRVTSVPSSPASANFPPDGRHAASMPITDAADVISPFLAMSPGTRRVANPGHASPSNQASEKTLSPRGRRARLNPPPYEPEPEPEPSEPGRSSGRAMAGIRRLSTRRYKKRKGSESGMPMLSGHSRTPTGESAIAVIGGTQTEQGRPRAATTGVGGARPVTVVSVASGGRSTGSANGGGNVAMLARGGRADRRLSLV